MFPSKESQKNQEGSVFGWDSTLAEQRQPIRIAALDCQCFHAQLQGSAPRQAGSRHSSRWRSRATTTSFADDNDSHVEEFIALTGDYRVARVAFEEAVQAPARSDRDDPAEDETSGA